MLRLAWAASEQHGRGDELIISAHRGAMYNIAVILWTEDPVAPDESIGDRGWLFCRSGRRSDVQVELGCCRGQLAAPEQLVLGLGIVVREDGGLVLGVDIQEVVFEGQAHHTAEKITLSGQIHKELNLLVHWQAEAQSNPITQSLLIL